MLHGNLYALMCMRACVYASGHFRSTLPTISLPPNALRWWHLEAERDTLTESQSPPPFPPLLSPQVLMTTQDSPPPPPPPFLTLSPPNKYLIHPSLIRILGEYTPALAYMHESFLIKFT